LKENGDPSEDASVATVVFLLDGKLVLLRPSIRTDAPATDLRYDMRVLSDKIEFFLLLPSRGDETSMSTLKGSIWAWDGKDLKVTRVKTLDVNCRFGYIRNVAIHLEKCQLL